MAFYDPHTWSQNELVTHEILNTEIRDQLIETQVRILALEAALAATVTVVEESTDTGWTAYTPALQASILPPAIGLSGGGFIQGKYKKIGKTVVGYGQLQFGNTMNRGSGNYYLTLPVNPIVGSSASICGAGYIEDNSEGVLYTTVCRISGTRLEMMHTSTLRRYRTTALLPIPMFTDDSIFWNFCYEVL